MPTQIPDPQIMQSVTGAIDKAFQQGVVGVLLLIAASGLFIAAAVFIVAWSRRNLKPVDTTPGTNAAINAFAEMINAQNKQIEEDRLQRKEENAANREQMKLLNERYIESISANADATNRIADNQDRLTVLLNATNAQQSTDIGTIKDIMTNGSKPLQGLIETAGRIEVTVDHIVQNLQPANKEYHKKQIADFQKAIDELKQFVVTIATNMQNSSTDKRATGSLRPVTVSGQDSIESG